MPNVRALNKDKYKISNYRFRELYYYCLQYNEWREALAEKRNPLKGQQYSGMPSSGLPGNPTMNVAIDCAEYAHKCAVIEQAAKLADPDLYEYIIYAVTNEKITFKYLKMQMNIPCESDCYYNCRRKFYFILDKMLRYKKIEAEEET